VLVPWREIMEQRPAAHIPLLVILRGRYRPIRRRGLLLNRPALAFFIHTRCIAGSDLPASRGANVTPTKILWGQIVVVLLVALAGVWGATEWTAWRLGFQQQLGPAWFTLADLPVYLPPSFFWWWYHFDAYAPTVFIEGAAIASSGGFIAVAVAIAGSM
jgi:hypothetical protein